MGLFSALMGNAGTASLESLQQEYGKLMVEGEAIEIGFKLIRDTFIFSNKRIILVEKQGITGSKVAYTSIPYKSITRFSIESAGTFDLDAELKVWVSSEANPSIVKQFNKSVNVYDIQKIITFHTCK